MAQAKQYNGHRSWNAWNVALWIGNDEPLYRFAIECLNSKDRNGKPRTLDSAARAFSRGCPERTPDGARYNITCIREALAGLRD